MSGVIKRKGGMKGREGRRGGGQRGTEVKKKRGGGREREREMGIERSRNRNELSLYYTRLDIAQHFLWHKMSVPSCLKVHSDLKLLNSFVKKKKKNHSGT